MSNDGDAIGNHGMGDVFAIHLSSAGIIQWRNIYGGSDFETGYSIQQGIQGESIIIGYSSSSDGDLGSRDSAMPMYGCLP